MTVVRSFWLGHASVNRDRFPSNSRVASRRCVAVCPSRNGASVPALPDHLAELARYEPREAEWSSELGRDGECARLTEAIDHLKQLSYVEPFAAPVDLSLYKNYAVSVAYPVDLHTMQNRLKARFYR